MRNERAVAFHEAGHAVVARLLGVKVDHLTMFSTGAGNSASATTQSAVWQAVDADLTGKIEAVMKDMKVRLGGPHAQAQHLNMNDREVARALRNEWTDDVERARHLAAAAAALKDGAKIDLRGSIAFSLGPEQTKAAASFFDRANDEVEVLIKENWTIVERVAEALLSKRAITDEELDVLIDHRQSAIDALLKNIK